MASSKPIYPVQIQREATAGDKETLGSELDMLKLCVHVCSSTVLKIKTDGHTVFKRGLKPRQQRAQETSEDIKLSNTTPPSQYQAIFFPSRQGF